MNILISFSLGCIIGALIAIIKEVVEINERLRNLEKHQEN